MRVQRKYLLFPLVIAVVMLFGLPGFAAQTKDLKPTAAGESPTAAKAGSFIWPCLCHYITILF